MITHPFKRKKEKPNVCRICNEGRSHELHNAVGYSAPPELEEVPTFEIQPETADNVRNFEAAVRRHEMRSSLPREEWEEVDETYSKTKRRLYLHLIYLQEEIDQ